MIIKTYSSIRISDKFIDREIHEYNIFLEAFGLEDSNTRFFAFIVSRLFKKKLNFNMLVVGRARSSKTTFGYSFVNDFMFSRNTPLDSQQKIEEWVNGHVIYDSRQRSNAEMNGLYMDDEGMLTGDRRRSMARLQVQKTENLQFYADMFAVNITLIQNFSDLDLRIVDASNAVVVVTSRGEGLLFIGGDAIALVKNTFGFEMFNEHPELLDNNEIAMQLLRSKASYIFDLTWRNMDDDPLYVYGKKKKTEYQEARRNGTFGKDKKPIDEADTKRSKIIELLMKGGMTQLQIAKEVGVSDGYVNKVKTGVR